MIKGRKYWPRFGVGRFNAHCEPCYLKWLGRPSRFDGTTVVSFFKVTPNCSDCSDTRRDPLPWSELYRDKPAEWW